MYKNCINKDDFMALFKSPVFVDLFCKPTQEYPRLALNGRDHFQIKILISRL